MRRLRTGTTIIGARRSKGNTNPANLDNLAEREESRSSLFLSNVERSKKTDENKMPIHFPFFNYFAGLDFFPHLG